MLGPFCRPHDAFKYEILSRFKYLTYSHIQIDVDIQTHLFSCRDFNEFILTSFFIHFLIRISCKGVRIQVFSEYKKSAWYRALFHITPVNGNYRSRSRHNDSRLFFSFLFCSQIRLACFSKLLWFSIEYHQCAPSLYCSMDQKYTNCPF